jgi:CRISPR-associated protein Cas4
MEYNEEDFLMLSGIQHFVFCRRQWALIHIEQQWAENLRTIEGNIMHQKAHDGFSCEKRGNIIISRGMAVFSKSMGTNGICDIVEFHKDDNGIPLYGRQGKYQVFPVEYKKGKEKQTEADVLQVVAQAMCLEEMLCCKITKGYIFYGETKRRTEIIIQEELHDKVRKIFDEMHQFYNRNYTPKVKRTKSCNACSLKDICLPALNKNQSAKEYIQMKLGEDGML